MTGICCGNCLRSLPRSRPAGVRGPDVAWCFSCQACADLVVASTELVDLPGSADAGIEIQRCLRCRRMRACAPGWTTRCHLCLDKRSDPVHYRRGQVLLDRRSKPAQRRSFDEFRAGLSYTSGLLRDAAAFLNERAVVKESQYFERDGWTVQALDLCGMPWNAGRQRARSHGTWGHHQECGTLQLLKPRERILECVTCPPPPGSRSARARHDDPYLLYLVRHRGLLKFGVGDDRRVRAHLNGGATVVKVLKASFFDVCRAELDLKRYHRAAGHLVVSPSGAPVTFGTGTEVVPATVTVNLKGALQCPNEDVTDRFRQHRHHA
ncbi:hypothetical protein [Actinoplanes sp. NPDC049802]|uniref:hypothetical protein n=1 Tax=Actinoplanes sp. NPDC049802 TaxID=3154742 RepID=UPI0033C4E4FC